MGFLFSKEKKDKDLSEFAKRLPVYIRVPIKEKLKHGLIFGFKARLAIAEVLSFLGYDHDVLHLLQKLSHGTRAYI